MPLGGVPVGIACQVRRFFCDHPDCPQRIFCERLDGAVAYARKTQRLVTQLLQAAFALGGQAGARLCRDQGIIVSPDTLLRLIRQSPLPTWPTPRVLGVDDWAIRKGARYGTILYDVEQHRPIELLLGRSADVLCAWLEAHPGVEFISRDRASAYANAAAKAAPQAIQVADRFHLLCNASEALTKVCERHHNALFIEDQADHAQAPETPSIPLQPEQPRSRYEQERAATNERRQARFDAVWALHEQGVSLRKIARELGINRKVVAKFVRIGHCPPISPRQPQPTLLDPYRSYLLQRWQEGCHNATQIYREIKDMGYMGSRTGLSAVIAKLRKDLPSASHTVQVRTPQSTKHRLAPRRVARILAKAPDQREPEEAWIADVVCQAQCQLLEGSALSRRFISIIKERCAEELMPWLEDAVNCGIREIVSFAKGVESDHAAVLAALQYPYSQGPVEGAIHRLKLIKRKAYGRAGFDLLRKLVLAR